MTTSPDDKALNKMGLSKQNTSKDLFEKQQANKNAFTWNV